MELDECNEERARSMTTWNHRVIKRKEGDDEYYSIHEVHYFNDFGKPVSCTENAVSIDYYEKLEYITWALERMQHALEKPVLNYEDF